MAASTGKLHCVTCGKQKCTLRCAGCTKDFCLNHLTDHRQELDKHLNEIDANRDLFAESLGEKTKKLQENPLIQKIDIWERDSTKIIRETAEAAKQSLIQDITGHYNQVEMKLNKLTKQLREVREENDFNEINLRQFEEELLRLSTESIKLPLILTTHDSWTCISNVYAKVSGFICLSSFKAQSDANMKNIQRMAALQGRLDPAHEEIDDSFRCRIQQVSENVSASISQVIADTQDQQATLLADANGRIAQIEEDYTAQLQRYVGELDRVKTQNLDTVQKDLHLRHLMIFEQARKSIDDLYEEANHSKMSILQGTQAQVNVRVERTAVQLDAEVIN